MSTFEGYDPRGLGRTGTPWVQVRRRLEVSKRAGVKDFDLAWRNAVSRVAWPHCTAERRLAKALLADPQHVAFWKAAYEDQPAGAALATLAPEPERDREEHLVLA